MLFLPPNCMLPSEMPFDSRALDALDFPRILAELAERASGELGKERISNLRPSNNAGQIVTELDEVEDALFGVSLSLGGIHDIRELHQRSAEGLVLSGEELLLAAYSLDGAMTVRRAIDSNSRGPLRQVALGLGDHSELVQRFLSALDRDGKLRDEASPRLRELRRRIEPLRGRIRDKLTNTLEQWAELLQENIVTLRRERYVLPVQASRVSQVQGIIVDASATGQTYFVEPAVITQLNNELARLILDEEAEVRRILTELSSQLAADEAVPSSIDTVSYLDVVAAKARLARDWKLNRPEQAPRGYYQLQSARHPLIENPVANDMQLDEKTQLLLITGPNMGGKTATLKTLGLAVLMQQCGMYVAAAQAKLPVVEDVLVDIGDEQSIEASLSTFASHLKHLRHILQKATPDTLLLVDELGSGTDPDEGAALSQAIIERLLEKEARGILTSHLAPLKLFALETSGLKNASMGFELTTLTPTYQLQVGQPGRSYALAIAGRMGLAEGVLSRAKDLLGEDAGMTERLLAGLECDRQAVADELVATQQARQDSEATLAKLQREQQELAERRQELLIEASQKAEAIYADATERVRTLRARAKDDAARPRVMEELKELRGRVQKSRPKPKKSPEENETLQVGAKVNVPAYNASGRILEMRGNELVVQLGMMKVNVKRRDVRLVAEKKAQNSQGTFFKSMQSEQVRELQLLGMTVERATEELHSAVVEAHALKERQLRVVHGKGTGALRRSLREYLKNEKRVESYCDAEPNQGGHGVTVVRVKV